MVIGLASPRPAPSLDEGLQNVDRLLGQAAARGAEVVCFPEAYLPGLRGQDFPVPAFEREDELRAIVAVSSAVARHRVAAIVGMEHVTDAGSEIVAVVFKSDGTVEGAQAKVQLDPTEEAHYVPGSGRQLFEVNGVRFGIAICHEGFRYPETVRWAARRGASIVFHPQLTGTHGDGMKLTEWGAADAPYYERAMMMRSLENGIYFASVNYALPSQESATCLIGPDGGCEAWLSYGEEGVLTATIEPLHATGLLARRYAPERYDAGQS
jgi:predicted amidohydrolase